jgi:hypothetical protein
LPTNRHHARNRAADGRWVCFGLTFRLLCTRTSMLCSQSPCRRLLNGLPSADLSAIKGAHRKGMEKWLHAVNLTGRLPHTSTFQYSHCKGPTIRPFNTC